MRSRTTLVIITLLQRVVVSVVLVGSSWGCGAPSASTRSPEMPTRSATAMSDEDREWVFVQAPAWAGDVYSISTPTPDSSYCITARSTRACRTDGAWTDIAWGSADALWLVGRSNDDWVFSDGAAGVFVAHGFTGALRELPQAVPSWSLGPAWQAPARLTIDGTLLTWSGSEFAPLPIPGRVYDAAFSDLGMGIALAEPGVVHIQEPGQPWTLLVQRGLVPPSVAELDRATLPNGFGALIDQAASHEPEIDPEFLDEVEQAWLAELLQRFGQARGATLPDFVPALLHDEARRNVIASPVELYRMSALARGWVGRGSRGGNNLLVHVSPDMTTRVLAEGPAAVLLSNHDGQESLAIGRPCLPHEADGDKTHRACFTDASGARTVLLPPGVECAEVVALGSGQLLVGGRGCPAAVCGEHLLVRFDLRHDGTRLDALPVPIDGDAPREAPPRERDRCYFAEDSAPVVIPDGASVTGTVTTAAGVRLMSGPLNGTLRALLLPAEGEAAFADARHGVFVGQEAAWTTSDGGESWNPAPIAMGGPIRREPLMCSADACRLGSAYWMVATLADQLGLERRPLRDAGTIGRTAPPHFANAPWSLTAPSRASLTPSNALVPLERSWPPPGWSDVRPVVGGIVATRHMAPERTGDFSWRGVTQDGVPFRVATTATDHALQLDDYSIVAMTERFLALQPFASLEIIVIRRNGQVSHHRTRLVSPVDGAIRWPLPLPDGGLGVYLHSRGTRWLLRFSPEGDVLAERVFEGPPLLRNEFIAWHEGELGLAVRASDDRARLYLVDGGERDISLPRTPEGPCGVAVHARSNRYASRWGAPPMSLASSILPDAEWILSEEHSGSACIRAMMPPWPFSSRDPQSHGFQLVMAIGGVFRGWFISRDGTVEWPVTFPGTSTPGTAIEDEYEYAFPSAPPLDLMATQTSLTLWAPLRAGSDRAELFAFPWGGQGFVLHPMDNIARGEDELRLLPGILMTNDVAYPLQDGVVQSRRDPPDDGQFGDAVHGAHGTTLVTRLGAGGHRVDWPGGQGDALHAYLPPAETEVWRWPRITNDGRNVVELAHSGTDGELTLQLHRLLPDGTIASGAPSTAATQDFARPWQFMVASSDRTVVAALAGLRDSPIHVFGTSGTRAFQLLGHPIATSRCASRVLAVAAAPPRVVWADCAIGTERRFVRVAQLMGNRWREVAAAHPLPHGVPRVAAAIDGAHGVYVVYLENSEAVLVTPRGAGWDVVTRHAAAPR